MDTIQLTPQLMEIIGDMPHRFAMPLEREIFRQLQEKKEALMREQEVKPE